MNDFPIGKQGAGKHAGKFLITREIGDVILPRGTNGARSRDSERVVAWRKMLYWTGQDWTENSDDAMAFDTEELAEAAKYNNEREVRKTFDAKH